MEHHKINKQPFYVFTSIDGVLYDYESAARVHTCFFKNVDCPILNKSSIEALNYLLSTLEEFYDTKLIITSPRRKNMAECINYLKSYGLKYDKPIFATPLKKGKRGQKILNEMKKDNLNPTRKLTLSSFVEKLLTSTKDRPSFDNYVVIDCKPTPRISRNIPKQHIIKTDYNNAALSKSQVESFLQQHLGFHQYN